MLLQDLLVILVIIVLCMVFLVISRKTESLEKFKFFFGIPAVLMLTHLMLVGPNLILIPTYFSALLCVIAALLRKKRVLFYISLIAALLVGILSIVLWISLPSYASLSNERALKQVVVEMQENYVLREYKEIDYPQLLNKYTPMMKAADEEQDQTAAYLAWLAFASEFHDAHVSCTLSPLSDDEIKQKAREQIAGYDYGFSMITLSTGETVACLVDENSEAYQKGIRTGTVIKEWNEIPIDLAKSRVTCFYPGLLNYPVLANEMMVQSIFLAGGKTSTLSLACINDKGEAVALMLNSMGSYQKRLSQALNAIYATEKKPNMTYEIMENGYGYLCVNRESNGLMGTVFGNYDDVGDTMKEMISLMKENNICKCVIDLRGNVGGDDAMGMAILSYFTDKEMFYYADGIKIDDQFRITEKYICEPRMMWDDVEITVLVNSMTVSAGDGLAYNLGKLPNAKIAGMTDSACSFQAVGGNCVVNQLGIILSYPVISQLNESDQIMIDTDASRQATIARDIQIPVNREALDQIFGENYDYELAYLVSR